MEKGFRELMNKYCAFIEYYRIRARQMLNKVGGHMNPRYRISLEIIYGLYLQVYDKINIENGTFTTDELNPFVEEIRLCVNRILDEQSMPEMY